MNYTEAMDFLEETKKYGSQLGLGSIRRLMARLGDVQDAVPVVHIGGTNGKGSVGAMLNAALTEAGYKVGRFCTPDVFSYEDEFQMNGVNIEKHRLAQLFTKVKDACEELTEQGFPHPTRFEVETAAAFLWFYEEDCEIALVEVGMGGETDATNLIRRPLVSVLTSIGMDHTRFLGNSLAEIARVKSGIIKPGAPVVSMRQKTEAMEEIQKAAAEYHSKLIVVESECARNVMQENGRYSFRWRRSEEGNRRNNQVLRTTAFPGVNQAHKADVLSGTGNVVAADSPGAEHVDDADGQTAGGELLICLSLCGKFQVDNALCALEVLKLLRKSYPGITDQAIRDGLSHTVWPGRLERIGSDPDFYLDGAHNEDAVRKLRAALDEGFSGRKIIYIMGVLADKAYDQMIEIMFRPGDIIYTVTPDNPRALDGKELSNILVGQKMKAQYCENTKDAVLYALRDAQPDEMVLAFGSLSYLKNVRRAYEAISK